MSRTMGAAHAPQVAQRNPYLDRNLNQRTRGRLRTLPESLLKQNQRMIMV